MKTELSEFIKKHLGSTEGYERGETYPRWKGDECRCEEQMAKDILKFINKSK